MPPDDPTPLDLRDRAALVTGAASGIGLSTARRLRADGANVTLVDIDEVGGRRAADEIGATFVAADVRDPAAVTEAFRVALDAHGRLDIAHLNAGVLSRESDIARISDEEYRRVLGINVDGVVFGLRESVKAMQSAGGAIVVSSSLSGVHPWPIDPLYTLTKHAVVGLVRALAPTLMGWGITLNCICPPFVDTAMAASVSDSTDTLMSPDVVAEAVVRVLQSGRSGEAWMVGASGDIRPHRFRQFPLGLVGST
jgi:NAD(P)-dependent dehydrogenase (short-subunit alcohol dehydrogenase family)